MVNRSGVAVVGSINADLAAFGSPLPRPGETVIGTDFTGAWRQGRQSAIAAARAGAKTYMIGAVGDDLFRDLARRSATTVSMSPRYASWTARRASPISASMQSLHRTTS